MLYINKDSGQAIGEILSVLAEKYTLSVVDIKLGQDFLTTSVAINSSTARNAHNARNTRNTRTSYTSSTSYNTSTPSNSSLIVRGKRLAVIYDGLSSKEWADKLRVSRNTILERIKKHGNPYGRKGPTDSDKIIAGS